MRILVVDNLAVLQSRRKIYRALAQKISQPIHLLVPYSWKEQGLVVECEEEPTELLKLYKSPFLFGYRHQRIIYVWLKNIIKQINPEIIFISSEPENFNTFHLVRIKKKHFCSTKIVCATWRNIDYRFNPYPYKFGFLNKFIEKYNLKYIDMCFAHCYSAVSIMKDISNWDVVFVPPVVDIKNFVFKPKSFDDFVVGYIGRLSREKGVDVLLQAIANVRVKCLIVGSGPEKRNLIHLAKDLGILDKIAWFDAVKYEKVPEYLQKINVLVLPSRSTKIWKEQFGRILIEAMASGAYVVGSDCGDIPNVIGKYGFIFPEGDVCKLSEILKKIMNKNVSEQILSDARRMVEEKYSIENVVDIMYEAFKKLHSVSRYDHCY